MTRVPSVRTSKRTHQQRRSRGFFSRPYIEAVNSYRNGYADLRSKITFGFASNAQGRRLVNPYKAGLNVENMLIEERHGSYHLRVVIDGRTERVQSMGFSLARSAINLTVEDPSGTTIGSNKLNITGQSTKGFTVAEENAAFKLKRLIGREGS